MKSFGLGLCWLAVFTLLLAFVACESDDSKQATLPDDDHPGGSSGGDDDDASDDDVDDDTTDDDTADDDTADDDTTDDDTDNVVLAVIYNYDESVPSNYAGVFNNEDITVTGIHEDEVTSADFAGVDVLLIDSETDWYSSAEVSAIAALDLPIIGIYEGGGILFDKLDLDLGYNSPDTGETDNYATAISVTAPSHNVFTEPHDLGVDEGDDLTLYGNATNLRYHDLLGLILPSVTVLGERTVSLGYSAITLESGQYIYWGFFTNPTNLTEVGVLLLANCIYYLAD